MSARGIRGFLIVPTHSPVPKPSSLSYCRTEISFVPEAQAVAHIQMLPSEFSGHGTG